VKKRTLLVDADIVAYKFASATEQVFYFDGKGEEPCVVHDLDEALAMTDEYIADLRVRLAADEVIICLTDPDSNFRTGIDPTYKGNRKGVRKPTDLAAVKEHFKVAYRTYQRPGLEADDCMGILATHPTLLRGEKVIVSEDKDMQTIPGLLLNPAKDEKPRRVTRLAADLFHLWQAVVGDTSDGYPGARGVGPKSPEATGVLASKTAKEAWGHVVAAHERARGADAGTTAYQRALVQARLARILRASDWDFTAKKPRLWQPPA